jgi:hypothetical protein
MKKSTLLLAICAIFISCEKKNDYFGNAVWQLDYYCYDVNSYYKTIVDKSFTFQANSDGTLLRTDDVEEFSGTWIFRNDSVFLEMEQQATYKKSPTIDGTYILVERPFKISIGAKYSIQTINGSGFMFYGLNLLAYNIISAKGKRIKNL